MTGTALLRRATAEGGRRALKFSAVSVVGVAVTQALLVTLHGMLGWGATTSNLVAVSVAAVPAYVLNRAWVWGKRGPSHLRREVLPFWGFALAGLALSTIVVHVVTDVWASALAVNLANIGAFGVLWVAKFLVLDAVVFGEATRGAVAVPAVETV